LTSKRALKVWILIVFAFLGVFGTFNAWILWQQIGADSMVAMFPSVFGIQISVATYFVLTLAATCCLFGAICYVVFSRSSLELSLYQLGKDIEERLDEESREIKDTTDRALTKLGLREFRLKESMKAFQERFEEFSNRMGEKLENQEKDLETARKKLTGIENKIDRLQTAQKELSNLRRLQVIETVEKDLKGIKGIIEKFDSVPEPYLTSTDKIEALEGSVLKGETVLGLKSKGIEKIEDLLLRNPVEIGMTRTMSESEAKSLQSIIQLLMVPGVQREDAMLLLKSGVNSRQELALQDPFSLGAKISKTAELCVNEGKFNEEEKPSLEKIASWIKWAKT